MRDIEKVAKKKKVIYQNTIYWVQIGIFDCLSEHNKEWDLTDLSAGPSTEKKFIRPLITLKRARDKENTSNLSNDELAN